MEHLLYETQQARQQRHLAHMRRLLLLVGIIIAALLLAVLKLIGNERTIIVPMHGDMSYWVDKNSVSENYLQQITENITWLRLNSNPAIANSQQQRFLSYVHPQYYSELQQQLATEIETIMQQQITLNYYPATMEIDSDRLQIIISGDINIQVAQSEVISEAARYLIAYKLRQGRLWVSRFERLGEDDDI